MSESARWAEECYQALLDAQRNPPSPFQLDERARDDRRRAMNARIKRRLPKVV